MTIGIHHIALSAADLTTGAAFYDTVFREIGYRRGHTSEDLCTWVGAEPEILLYAAAGSDAVRHRHGAPGLQHAAFEVSDRATVLAVHKAATDGGWTVIHPPKLYDYSEGYFATFLEDNDGSRWEFAHIPTPTS